MPQPARGTGLVGTTTAESCCPGRCAGLVAAPPPPTLPSLPLRGVSSLKPSELGRSCSAKPGSSLSPPCRLRRRRRSTTKPAAAASAATPAAPAAMPAIMPALLPPCCPELESPAPELSGMDWPLTPVGAGVTTSVRSGKNKRQVDTWMQAEASVQTVPAAHGKASRQAGRSVLPLRASTAAVPQTTLCLTSDGCGGSLPSRARDHRPARLCRWGRRQRRGPVIRDVGRGLFSCLQPLAAVDGHQAEAERGKAHKFGSVNRG